MVKTNRVVSLSGNLFITLLIGFLSTIQTIKRQSNEKETGPREVPTAEGTGKRGKGKRMGKVGKS